MRRHVAWIASAALVTTLTLAACGGDDSPSTTTPTPTPTPPTPGTTITITASGVSPQSIAVTPGARVTFVNNDTRNHEMNSNPHPAHGDCPEINQVGFLSPGQSRQTGNLNTVRTCGFHDHGLPSTASLQGMIVIQP
jgi:plastocyanin